LHWNRLPGTSDEAAAIDQLFRAEGHELDGATQALGGAEATEEEFRALAPYFRILHLATHGFFSPPEQQSALALVDPEQESTGGAHDLPPMQEGLPPGLLSGLVLAGANDPPALPDDPSAIASLPEDGILTAEELAFLPLGNVELVVLRACETGLGEVAGGEGLLGIQRAFQVAGARTTVASLWKVDDTMTRRLMTAFYRNVLDKKQSYLAAMRNAQLEILQELRAQKVATTAAGGGDRGAAAPADAAAGGRGPAYYWAAFTLSGDWR
jgi:CHAT domain-containing protein